MPRCLVALGSNLGDRHTNVTDALVRLRAHPTIRSPQASSLHESEAIGGPSDQAPFVNAAVAFETDLAAVELLAVLQVVEQQLGRERLVRWGARKIDLDLLLYGASVISTPSLEVPHPRMAFRRFVLVPAVEVAADMLHPATGWTLRQLLMRLDTTQRYVAILGLVDHGKTELARQLAGGCGGRFLADPARTLAVPGTGDPPSPDSRTPIEFLDARAHSLDRQHWQKQDEWVVSDFYLDECLALARVKLDAEGFQRVADRWQAVRDRVVEPKLLVLWIPPMSALTEGGQDRRLVDEFRQLASRSQIAPTLLVDPRDPELALAEVAAAVDAMR